MECGPNEIIRSRTIISDGDVNILLKIISCYKAKLNGVKFLDITERATNSSPLPDKHRTRLPRNTQSPK